ncbi:MAG: type secretion system family protein, partial [Novosphingobium sp.]|nr:type secretion system family protein [Novosphingobium sp.]
MLTSPPGPTLLGVDVVYVGTILAAVAALAVFMAIYAAITVRDPMQRRVKALTARREQLKAGIVTGTAKKRASLVRKTESADKLRDSLSAFKMLQDSQVKQVQQKLAQAGIRKKELAFAVILGRVLMPIVIGGAAAALIYWIDYFPAWGAVKRFGAFALAVFLGYKSPDIYLNNLVSKRTDAIRKGLPDALDLMVICAEAGLTVDAAFNRVAKELGRAYP